MSVSSSTNLIPRAPNLTHIALLRGINVGGNHKLPMKDLARIFVDAGASDVVTFIQSGNVVFDAEPEEVNSIVSKVEESILEQFGFPAPIVWRTAAQMQAICSSNPHTDDVRPDETLYVMLLRDIPTEDQIAGLDPDKFLPDRYQVIGQEIFLRFETSAAKTKLTNAYFDKKLATISTTRNMRTLCTLAEMAAARQI